MTSSSSAGICAVVPTHNRRRRLERALRSVEAQTRLPDRVMVIDDGSTDGSEAMVRERFPRVELLR